MDDPQTNHPIASPTRVRMVVLEHTTAHDTHLDWMIQSPVPTPDPRRTLWTARLRPHPRSWPEAQRFAVQPIALHRTRYLDYEGPTSDGKGRVKRVAAGHALIHEWSDQRITLTTDWPDNRGRVVIELGERPIAVFEGQT